MTEQIKVELLWEIYTQWKTTVFLKKIFVSMQKVLFRLALVAISTQRKMHTFQKTVLLAFILFFTDVMFL